jgi:hypothetical protein
MNKSNLKNKSERVIKSRLYYGRVYFHTGGCFGRNCAYQYHWLLAALCAGLETDSTSGQLGPDPTLCGSVCVSSGTKVPLGD